MFIHRVFIEYCFFSREFSLFCHLSLARLLLVVRKWPANRSDCTLALRWWLWRSLLLRDGLQWIGKTQFEHPGSSGKNFAIVACYDQSMLQAMIAEENYKYFLIVVVASSIISIMIIIKISLRQTTKHFLIIGTMCSNALNLII